MLQFFPDVWYRKKKEYTDVYWTNNRSYLDRQMTNPPIEKVHSEGLLQ